MLYNLLFFFTFSDIGSNDGCFVQPKHVAAIGFAVTKVVRRWA
jgi:hypothetical protein